MCFQVLAGLQVCEPQGATTVHMRAVVYIDKRLHAAFAYILIFSLHVTIKPGIDIKHPALLLLRHHTFLHHTFQCLYDASTCHHPLIRL